MQVYLNLAAHPDVVNFKEQLTHVDFEREDGSATYMLVDLHVLLKDATELLVSVKYDEKANRPSYLAEIDRIAGQNSDDIADRLLVLSRYSFHQKYRACAQKIHMAKRGWDPKADEVVLQTAQSLGSAFTFGELETTSGLAGRGHRAAIRLIGDGDIGKHSAEAFAPDTKLWAISA